MDDSNPLEVSEAPRVIAGFWRRVFGVFIDSLILGACGLFPRILVLGSFHADGTVGANSRLSWERGFMRAFTTTMARSFGSISANDKRTALSITGRLIPLAIAIAAALVTQPI
jgi:hypothetical protein